MSWRLSAVERDRVKPVAEAATALLAATDYATAYFARRALVDALTEMNEWVAASASARPEAVGVTRGPAPPRA